MGVSLQTTTSTCESHPILKLLKFNSKTAQLYIEKNDFILLEGNTMRAIEGGIERAFGPSGSIILTEVGKYVGRDNVANLIANGVKLEKSLDWLKDYFIFSGWGALTIQIIQPKKEAVLSVENCVTTRNVKSNRPVCHFICGYFSGVFESIWENIVECTELQCAAKGDPLCTFRVRKMFR